MIYDTGTVCSSRGVDVPAHPKLDLATAERELSVPKRRWARSVPAVAKPLPLLGDGWRPTALTLTLVEPANSSCRVDRPDNEGVSVEEISVGR